LKSEPRTGDRDTKTQSAERVHGRPWVGSR